MIKHKQFNVALSTAFLEIWKQRSLIWQLTKRDVVGRYRGSIMGVLWSFLNPLAMLVVYTFVFSSIMKTKWNTGSSSLGDFAIVLFAGMIIVNLFCECINRAPNTILSNPNFVKKVVFPIEMLPLVNLGSALFHTIVSTCILLIFMMFSSVPFTAYVFLLPVILLPFVLLVAGLSWSLSAFGVYLRDLGQTVSIFTTILTFLSPLFYKIESVPKEYQKWIYLNPMTFIIEQARAVLIWGMAPDWIGLLYYFIGALFTTWVGYFIFQKTRKGFADVL